MQNLHESASLHFQVGWFLKISFLCWNDTDTSLFCEFHISAWPLNYHGLKNKQKWLCCHHSVIKLHTPKSFYHIYIMWYHQVRIVWMCVCLERSCNAVHRVNFLETHCGVKREEVEKCGEEESVQKGGQTVERSKLNQTQRGTNLHLL